MELCWITEAGVRPLSDDGAREAATRDDSILWAHCDHTGCPRGARTRPGYALAQQNRATTSARSGRCQLACASEGML